tara:strand:+ start:2660 stop:2962 length:303 start_codon:yes stop_codon:yes gene_type:complete
MSDKSNGIRCYFSRTGFEEMRNRIEEYVKERGTVPRESVINDIQGTIGRSRWTVPMTHRQLGYIVKYSEKQGEITSFIHGKQYYLTTVDNLRKLIKGEIL